MGNISVLKPREVVLSFELLGKQFRHADGRCTTVPFYARRDISPILLRQIAKDIRLSMDECLKVGKH